MEIGSLIRQLRKRAGYKQQDFAKACSISSSYLSQIEKGSRLPHENTLINISKVLGLPKQIIHFLTLTSDDIPQKKKEAFNIIFPSIRAFLIEAFLELEGLVEPDS